MCWSWADGLSMVQKRDPDDAHLIDGEMHQDTRSESTDRVRRPHGQRSHKVPTHQSRVMKTAQAPRGWQRPATSRFHEECVSEPAFSDTEKALMLSQSGHVRRAVHTRETRFDSQSFRLAHCTLLSVWPSTRPLWPPPRNVHEWEFWVGGASLWSLLQFACAEKQVGGS